MDMLPRLSGGKWQGLSAGLSGLAGAGRQGCLSGREAWVLV